MYQNKCGLCNILCYEKVTATDTAVTYQSIAILLQCKYQDIVSECYCNTYSMGHGKFSAVHERKFDHCNDTHTHTHTHAKFKKICGYSTYKYYLTGMTFIKQTTFCQKIKFYQNCKQDSNKSCQYTKHCHNATDRVYYNLIKYYM